MKIPIPIRVANAWDRFEDWINIDVIGPVRRIDLLLGFYGVVSVSYYSWAYGRAGGFSAALLYGLMLGTGLMFRK